MNLLKRLRNLWKLSKWEPAKYGENLNPDNSFTMLNKPKMAQIIKMKSEIKRVIEE